MLQREGERLKGRVKRSALREEKELEQREKMLKRKFWGADHDQHFAATDSVSQSPNGRIGGRATTQVLPDSLSLNFI